LQRRLLPLLLLPPLPPPSLIVTIVIAPTSTARHPPHFDCGVSYSISGDDNHRPALDSGHGGGLFLEVEMKTIGL
jgi:hypothetical protein